ncbi:MAG: transcription termination factor Rho [Phycisphaerae bacterium]
MKPFTGILELTPRGEGHLREVLLALPIKPSDPMIDRRMISDYKLREGCLIEGNIDGGHSGRIQVKEIIKICGLKPDDWREQTLFEEKVVIDPQPQLVLEPQEKNHEIPYGNISIRVIDLICPLGFGQRAVIVAPPRTGKTILLQQIGTAIKNNYPKVDLIMLLIDERPEEVTEMRRTIPGQVFASCNDRSVSSHTRLGKVIVEYGKSLAQAGRDAVIMLDSLTRLSRAYNIGQRGSGKTMSGGIDANALEIPKRLFGSARKFEHGGSLTIIASALIDTGSRMDELIFREFKGTGNMELVLSRELANERLFPAIDIPESGTRKDHLLVGRRMPEYSALRTHVVKMKPKDAMKSLQSALAKFATNSLLLNNLS